MHTIDSLLQEVRTSKSSDFYRARWDAAKTFGALPLVSRSDFARVPLERRRYRNESGLVKVVRSDGQSFLSEWSFDSIAAQEWAIPSKRPMVYLGDPYETLEKAAWFRERNMLPIAGERAAEVSQYLAEKYDIDSLVADSRTLAGMLPFLAGLSVPLEGITVIDSAFEPEKLAPLSRFAREMRLVLALPETGAIGVAALAAIPLFQPFPHVITEGIDGKLVVTQLLDLITPVIRFDTGLFVRVEGSGTLALTR